MLKPRRIDDLFEDGHPDEDNYVANLLHRKLFYKMQRNCNVDITSLIEACNEGWVQWWEQGDAVAIDEAVAPHKGRRFGGIIQYIPRKPHSAGIKLYVLCDSVSGYVLQVYLYTGKKGQLRRSGPKVAGKWVGTILARLLNASLVPKDTSSITVEVLKGAIKSLRRRQPEVPGFLRLNVNWDQLLAQLEEWVEDTVDVRTQCFCCAFMPLAREGGAILCQIRVHGGRQACRKTGPKMPRNRLRRRTERATRRAQNSP